MHGRREGWNEAEAILHSLQDDIMVTHPDGTILKVSRATGDIYGIDSSGLIGKSVYDLERQGVFTPLVTPMVVREKRKITFVQTTGQGKKLLVTGVPVFDPDGELVRVVSYSHDVTDLMELKEYLAALEEDLSRVRSELDLLRSRHVREGGIVARSRAMQNVLQAALKVAGVDVHVVLLGESGVGKSHLARWIHMQSPRKDGPFIEVNCGAIPEALFESEFYGYEAGAFTGADRKGKTGLAEMAEGGTLFLDEVAELSPSNQVKLLKFIQEKEFYRVGGTRPRRVNCRIIAAANRDLKTLVKEKQFREDLYFRLHVVPITIPPLRERREDVLPLVDMFLGQFSRKYRCEKKLDGAAMAALTGHDWPGNVRELMNTLEQMTVTSTGPVITAEDLPAHLQERKGTEHVWDGSKTLPELLEEVEKQALVRARRKCGTTVEMARVLGISQPTVVRKLKKYAID